jgi:hypothetical protein
MTKKTYSKKEVVNHYFTDSCPMDDSFVLLTGESEYRLGQWTEKEMEKMMRDGKTSNYITLEHVLGAISEVKNFLTPDQLQRVADEIEDF